MAFLKKAVYTTSAIGVVGALAGTVLTKTVHNVEVLETFVVSKSANHNAEVWVETEIGSFIFKKPFEIKKGDKLSFRVNLFNRRAKRIS